MDHREDDDDTEHDEESDDDNDDDDDCIEEDEDEENQVVPWSKPGQPASSSSRSDHECHQSNSFFGRQTSPAVSDTAFSWRVI